MYVKNLTGFALIATNFTDCHLPSGDEAYFNTLGGAVYSSYMSTRFISSCVGTHCVAGKQGGCFQQSYSTEYDVISNCKFLNSLAYTSSSAACYAGGLYVYSPTLQRLSDCLFSGCFSKTFGGAFLWYYVDTDPVTAAPRIHSCLFKDNKVERTDGGNDLSFFNSSVNPLDSECYTFTDQSNRVSINGSGSHTPSIDDSWLPFPQTVYVSNEAVGSSALCITPDETTCTTLTHAVDSLTPSPSSPLVIALLDPSHTKDTSSFVTDGCSFFLTSHHLNALSTLCITDLFTCDILFLINGGSLTVFSLVISVEKDWSEGNCVVVSQLGSLALKNLTFSSTPSYSFSTSPFYISAGSLTVQNAQICSFILHSSPLFTLSSSNLFFLSLTHHPPFRQWIDFFVGVLHFFLLSLRHSVHSLHCIEWEWWCIRDLLHLSPTSLL